MSVDTHKDRYIIALIVVMLALVEVLDITIISVAMRNMQGALAAAPDQITWTITAYVVSAAIVMPLTGLLSARFGRKQMLVLSAYGFTFSSFLCGLSQSLWQMVFFRACQGAFGALLPPLAQATLADTFRGKELPKAMALFGIGLMVGPIFGPILGGVISQDLGWRYVFFINIPIGIVGGLLAAKYLPETPKLERHMDFMGLGLLVLGVGSLQYLLDRGNELDWFGSNQIIIAAMISALALLAFIIRGWNYKDNVIRFEVLRDKNFILACLIMLIYFACFLGPMSWLPLWLELILNYPSATAGLVLMPRGIACLLTIIISVKIMEKMDARYFIALSTICYAAGTYVLSTYNLFINEANLILPNIFIGIAVGLFFIPLNALAYQSLAPKFINDASGLINFFRSMGSSIGVAVFTTFVTRQAQISWHQLGGFMNPFNPAFYGYLHQAHWDINNNQAYAQFAQILYNQSYMQGFIYANRMFSWMAVLVVPLVLMIDKRVGKADIKGE